jgi:hypothetical protein
MPGIFTADAAIASLEALYPRIRSLDALVGPATRVAPREADWRKHGGNLETEMLRRGMILEIIDWS